MSRNSSIEESSAWGEGYDAGQSGMVKAIKTAELLGAKRERERIIKLLEEHPSKDDFCAKCFDGPYDGHLIALIKEGKE